MKLKKNFLCLILISILPMISSAQIVEPVKWKFSAQTLANNEFEIVTTGPPSHMIEQVADELFQHAHEVHSHQEHAGMASVIDIITS